MTGHPDIRKGHIIPPEAAPLKALTVTMTVMCYLACLAIGALILINRAVDSWTSGLSREVTVQVRLQNTASPISAAAFTLNYSTNALRLSTQSPSLQYKVPSMVRISAR